MMNKKLMLIMVVAWLASLPASLTANEALQQAQAYCSSLVTEGMDNSENQAIVQECMEEQRAYFSDQLSDGDYGYSDSYSEQGDAINEAGEEETVSDDDNSQGQYEYEDDDASQYDSANETNSEYNYEQSGYDQAGDEQQFDEMDGNDGFSDETDAYAVTSEYPSYDY